eukprot:Rhum_TRINITY_DN14310_c7_g3::Rhum_TRINITY_DN14310_c7_g3_i1::g.82132::m.82132/K10396/KIF5; kinesin family member 5
MSRSRAKSFIEDQKASEGDAAAPDGEPMQSLSRCLVYARLRPTKPGELNEKDGTYKLVELKGKRITLGQEKEYDFDGSFGGDSTQDEVFEAVAKPSLNHVLSGYTAAMMAYGQTGTGKSWTMSNSRPGQEGIIPRSAGYLFDHIAATKTKEYTLTAHFVQIYRDQLSDLMSDKEGQKVDITFNQKTGVSIQNCTETEVPDKAAFLKMYAEGDSRRIVRPTKMNPESSRGHSALVLYVRSRSTDPDDMSMPTNGKITFIDLAGYERFDKTGVKDPIHKDEAKKINASLLSLGGVVTELSNGGKFVSWRNSKLTRLLQDSIGGKARSTIMICLGPSSASLHETTNSLDFGNRAMAVKVSAKVEQDVDYQKLATKLQTLLDEQEEKINALELSEKTREAERSDRERRHKLDMERLRNRHRDELTKLMEEGGTKERIQKLLEMQEAEDQNLQEMQAEEREYEDERAADDEREMVHEIEQQHRVRAASMRKEGGAMKQRELDAAILLIAKLRGVDQDPAALLEIAAEVATEAGSGDGGGGGGGGDEADAEAASPKTVTSAEIAILARQLDELKKESEQKETKAKETMDKMKAAHLKCANLLKEQREKTREMQDSSVKREELESLQGQLEEMASARNEAHSLREAMEEKLDKVTKEMHKASSEKEKLEVEVKKATSLIEQLNALKDDLEQQLQVLQQEKEEITEEHNRKERDREAVREESEAASTRKATELEDTIADLKKSIAALESSVAELGAEKAEAEKQIESLGETLAEQKRVLAAEEEAKQTLQSLVDAEKAATLEAETKHSQRQRELESAVEQCRDETRCVQSDLLREIEKTEETCSLKVSGLETELVELRKLIDENEQGIPPPTSLPHSHSHTHNHTKTPPLLIKNPALPLWSGMPRCAAASKNAEIHLHKIVQMIFHFINSL